VDSLLTLTEAFQTAAEKVSAVVARVKTLDEAVAYAVDLCHRKEACQLLISGCEAPLSDGAGNLCDQKQEKIMAAPGLADEHFDTLAAACAAHGIRLIRDGLREHVAGIDIGFTQVDYGIAETGTLVLDSSSEAMRLATMISEIHVALLPLSRLRPRVEDLEAELAGMMGRVPNYTAFITGASRTADIERVLALGVHGPLELHILVWEDC
jgi:L-lactate dehydrogenase complex protein LldG